MNAGSAWVIARAGGDSLNLRGAFLHLASDAAGSVGVVLAGAIILATGAEWVDPLVSILISVLVLFAAWQLLRDTTRVLLEGVPKGLDVDAVEQSLQDADGVEAVHHLHVWSIGSETPALSAHVVLGRPADAPRGPGPGRSAEAPTSRTDSASSMRHWSSSATSARTMNTTSEREAGRRRCDRSDHDRDTHRAG